MAKTSVIARQKKREVLIRSTGQTTKKCFAGEA